jgi:pimeloyl-ACP methyl ester carboxylesterase
MSTHRLRAVTPTIEEHEPMTTHARATTQQTDVADTTPSRVVERDILAVGVRLHVREVGDLDARPVLFLHGIMGHRREWDVLIDRLGQRHRVIAVDQRGHGLSEWTPSYRVADMASDAIEVIEQLATGPVAMVGHSMGAMVAMVMAARRPELVDRLVVIDIVPESLSTVFADLVPELFDAKAAATYDSIGDAVAEAHADNPIARVDLLHNYVSHALVPGPENRLRWGFDALGLRSFMAGVTAPELWAAIDAITCAGLVIRGEHSPLTTPEQAEAVAERLGRAHVVEIPDGGHDLGVERPEPVTTAVLDFLTAEAAIIDHSRCGQ